MASVAAGLKAHGPVVRGAMPRGRRLMRAAPIALLLVPMLSSCANMPPVTTTYVFPEARTALVVTQTLGCDKAATRLVSASNVVATTTYIGDPTRTAQISYGNFGGFGKDADLSVSLTSDGRLSGINSTTNGQGSTVVSGIVSLATAAATVAAAGLVDPGKQKAMKAAIKADCKALAAYPAAGGGASKVTTLTYSIDFKYDVASGSIVIDPQDNPNGYVAGSAKQMELIPDPGSQFIYSQLTLLAHAFTLRLDPGHVGPARAAAVWEGHKDWADKETAPKGYTLVKLNKVSTVGLTIEGPKPDFSGRTSTWQGTSDVPLDAYYSLPVPSGVLFGKQAFILSLADSGAITKLEYSSNSGASDALAAAGSIAKALPTTATETQGLNDQSALIHAQQRLVVCQTDPTHCPSS